MVDSPNSTAGTSAGSSNEELALVKVFAQREAELLEALRIARVGSWKWDIDSDRIEWSGSMSAIFGLDATSEPSRFTQQEGHYEPDSWARFCEVVAVTIASGEPYDLRLEIIHSSGEKRWIDGRGEPVRDIEGRIVGLRGTVHDVTSVVATERALANTRESLARQLEEIEQVYRDSPVGLFTFDRDLRFLRLNERMAEINGYPAEVQIGRTMREVVPHLAAPLEAIMRPVLDHGETVLGIEVRGRTPKAPDSDRDWLVNYFPMRDPAGSIVGLFGAVQEITERKRAEELLRHSEKRFRQLFDSSPIGKALVTLDGRFEAVNSALCAIVGYTAEELEALTFQAITVPEDLDDDLRQMADLLAGRITSYRMEKRYRRKDGAPIWVQLDGTLLRNDLGNPVHFIAQIQDISERKRLEQALLTERDRLRTVFDAAPSAILTVDAAGRIESANDRAEFVFGYTRAQLKTMQVEQLIPLAQHQNPLVLQDSLIDRGAYELLTTGQVIRGHHRDGHEIPLEVRLSRYSDQDGVKIIAIATDRSEQELLTESESRWRTMANSLPQLVWTCTAEGDCDFLSRQWEEYTGVPAERHLGSGWGEQIHPEDHQKLTQDWLTAKATAREFHAEFRIRCHDGTFRWFDTRAVPLKDSQGRVLKWIGSNTDIEDRRQAEAHVQDLNAHLEQRIAERTQLLDDARRDLRNILDALPSMVGYWDRQQRNRFANSAYLQWFGQAPEQIAGKSLREVLGPQIYELNRHHIERALAGEPQAFEREIPGPGGDVKYSLARYIPDLVEGEVRGFYALVHDVTEVRRAQAAAEAASEAKSTFLANVSHEIRTPMNAVLGFLQLLLRTHLEPEQQNYVSNATIAARTLLGILNDVLDFSKIEAGKMKLDPHPFSLEALMRELSMLLSAGRGNKPIEVVFEIDPLVPDSLIGDSLRIKQVLLNLAGNALKFTERGEVVVSITSRRVTSQQVELLFAIRDTGIGMSAEQCSRVFEGFVQGQADTTRRFGGTGLGLAICQRLALLMGGELSVKSQAGGGSQFDFTLVLDCDSSSDSRRPPDFVGLRVLLVEDHAASRTAIAEAVRACGHRVQPYADAASALAAAAAARSAGAGFDVALIKWPPVDGDAAGELSRTIGLPVAALCAQIGPLQAVNGVMPTSSRIKPVTGMMIAEAITEARWLAQPGNQVRNWSPATSRRLTGLKILVVEDNATNQLVAQGLLSAEGAEVHLAAGGAAGVNAVRSAPVPFDLVLMDVQMPDMDGNAATLLIRALPEGRDLPIVAMTANALDADRDACLRSGMNDHVGKPFDLDPLIETILRWCGRSAAPGIQPIPASPNDLILNRPAALRRMANSEEMYCEVAKSFLQDAPRLLADISATDPDDRTAPLRSAHTMRGLAGTVGAERLQKLSHEAEIALAGKRLPPDWARILSSLGAVINETLAELAAFAENGLSHASATSLNPVPASRWEELERLLAGWHGDALSVFSAIRAQHHCPDDAALDAIGDAIETLDFTTALHRVHSLRNAEQTCPESS